MSVEKGKYLGGVRTLDCIKRRCAVCEVSGCWVWTGYCSDGRTPMVRFEGEARTVRRVAAMLAGQRVTKKQRIVAKPNCDTKCVNPAHFQSLNGSTYINWLAQVSTMNGPAHHAARTAAQRARSVIKTVEAAEELRRRVAAGEDLEAVARSAGVTRMHLNKILRGRNWGAVAMPAGASVFSWAKTL